MRSKQCFPTRQPGSKRHLNVSIYLDPEGDFWIAESEALPLATEAPTLDALIARVWDIAPEIAALNGHRGALSLRFVLLTATPA